MRIVFSASALVMLSSPALAQDAADFSQITLILPREADIALALSAAPPHLRDGATVYVFTQDGYELAREGSNGFTCFNNRDAFFYGANNLKPTCWDAAGRDSYVPVMLDVGAMLAAGTPHEEIKAEIESGFASGRYREPSRSGVAYMLAGDVRVDGRGAVTEQVFPGHYMVYAPNVTNADLGYDREAGRADASLPFIYAGGAGGARLGYIIAAPDPAGPAHEH